MPVSTFIHRITPSSQLDSMTEQDKIRIKPLDDKSDYALWRIRVMAAQSAKGLDSVFKEKTNTREDSSEVSKAVTTDTSPSNEQAQQDSNIIVSALGDHAL